MVKVSHEMQEHFNSSPRDEVFRLLALIEVKKPCYSAAGFFMLNKSTLFALFSAITMYFIILIQFHY